MNKNFIFNIMTKEQTKTSKFDRDKVDSTLNSFAKSPEEIFDCNIDDGSGNRLSRFSILISSAENIEDIFQNKIFLIIEFNFIKKGYNNWFF